ncbi:YIP1 family protein [Bacillus stratosphericus]|uniref:YIP1 family protein n=1 Tax=Bacillus stratosphericus TaxID=293386 RepID=UPI001CFAD0EB|nr:YIP1 family protein [Bacillus stratosphericus]
MEAIKNDLSQKEEVTGFFRFFKIFVATKTIIRSYQQSSIPIWLMMLLASIAGTSWMYEGYFSEYMGNHIPFPFILLHGAGYGILVGNLILFFGALILQWLERLFFGSKTAYRDVLKACTLTVFFPSALFALTWIFTVGMLGPYTFVKISPYLDQHYEVWYYLDLLTLTEAYAKTWIFGMAVLGIVAVMKLRVWQAFMIVITPLAAFFIIMSLVFDVQRAMNWMM